MDRENRNTTMACNEISLFIFFLRPRRYRTILTSFSLKFTFHPNNKRVGLFTKNVNCEKGSELWPNAVLWTQIHGLRACGTDTALFIQTRTCPVSSLLVQCTAIPTHIARLAELCMRDNECFKKLTRFPQLFPYSAILPGKTNCLYSNNTKNMICPRVLDADFMNF